MDGVLKFASIFFKRHRLSISLTGILFCAYSLVFVGNNLNAIDEILRYVMMENVVHGNGFTSDYIDAQGKSTVYDAKVPKFGFLQPLLASPLYLLGSNHRHQMQLIDKLQVDLRQLAWVLCFMPLVTILACLVFFRCACKLTGSERVAWVAALLLGLCTIAFVYTQTFFSEPLTGLVLLLAYYFTISNKKYGLFLAGFFAALVSSNVALYILALPIFFAAVMLKQDSRPKGIRAAQFGAGALVGLLLLVYQIIVRQGTGYQYELGFITPLIIGLFGNLLSPGKSIFVFSPILILAAFGYPAFYRSNRFAATLALALAAIFTAAYSKWYNWAGGTCWGPRFLVPIVPFILLGILPLLKRWPAWNILKRAGLLAFVLLSLWVQIPAMLISPYASFKYTSANLGIGIKDNRYEQHGRKDNLLLFQTTSPYFPEFCPPYIQSRILWGMLGSIPVSYFSPAWIQQKNWLGAFIACLLMAGFAFLGIYPGPRPAGTIPVREEKVEVPRQESPRKRR